VTSTQNLIKCANRTGLHVSDIVLQQLASAEAVLTPDERELGVLVIDVGGGTTDLAVYTEGALKYTSGIGVGGNHFTNDIAVGLRTPTREAERIKKKWGIASVTGISAEDHIEVPSVGGQPARSVPRLVLAKIIEPRAEELLYLIRQELENSGYRDRLAGGAVFTGGTAQLEGLIPMAERILGMQCRLGRPRNIKGLSDIVGSPQFATAVGLMLHGARFGARGGRRRGGETMFASARARLKQWFGELAAAMF
jgi:cell division protein FtsA